MISRGTRLRAYNGLLDVLRQGNLAVLLIPLGLMVAGGVARSALTRKRVSYHWHGMTLSHPAGWAVAESVTDAGGDSVTLMDLLGPGRIKPRLTLRVAPLPEAAADVAAPSAEADGAQPAPAKADPAPPASPGTDPSGAWPAAPTGRLPLYYEMAEEPVQIGSFAGTRVDSAFAFTPKVVAGRKRDIPVVMRAVDVVVMRGAEALSAQVAAPIEDFELQRPNLEAIIASLQVDAAPATGPVVVPAVEAQPATPDAGVAISGQVVDAQSGLAVPGAIVLFLAPGTSVGDVDDDNLARVAYTTGMADSTGHFSANRGLTRSANFGVMVVADGYHWIGTDDAVAVAADGPETMDLGAIPLRRR